MNQEQINEMNEALNELRHWGVKGMKWGVRKRRDTGGGSGGSGSKKPQSKRSAAKAEQKARQAQAKSLIKERKAVGDKHFDKMMKENERNTRAIDKKFDKMKSEKLAKFDAQSKNKVDRAIGRYFTKKVVEMDRSAAHNKALRNAENKYTAGKRKRKDAHREATRKLEAKMDSKYQAMKRANKGKGFLKEFSANNKAATQILQETEMEYLKIDAKYGIKG